MTGRNDPAPVDPASNDADAFPLRRIQWKPGFRIVPTRFPTVYLFDRVADPEDFEALYALEALTNDRIRDETGQIELVAAADRIFGPGSGPIMAAFTHVNLEGSRFSDGRYGMFYAARERETAIAETRYHHGRFLAATAEPPRTKEGVNRTERAASGLTASTVQSGFQPLFMQAVSSTMRPATETTMT